MTRRSTGRPRSLLEREIASLRAELLGVHHKLNELLVRQVIPVDGGILAIRHQLGWLFVPQEDFTFVLHLANGMSGHEAGTLRLMKALLAPGDTVVDIGAHVGLLTIPLARHVGPTGRVIAVEPVPRTAECLRRALLSNDLIGRCEVMVGAASDRNGLIDFYLGSNSMMGSLVPMVDDQQAITVEEFRLDDRIAPGQRISMIKMDVEGAELTTLGGLKRTIADNDQLVLIAEYGPYHLEKVGIESEDWFATFADAGFADWFIVDEQNGELVQMDLDQVRDVFTVNILFARDRARVLPLVRS